MSIITSRPVWALAAAQTGCVFAFAILFTQIPTYLNKVMDFNIKDNSLLSSLPYLSFWILGQTMSFVSDYIINKKIVSPGAARKIFSSIGLFVPSAALILLGYTKADQTIQAVCLLVASVGFLSVSNLGWALNHMDLSPNYAGLLMGLINALSNIFSIIAPLSAQILITDEKNPAEWRIIFFLAAGFNICAAMIFNIFGSGKVQHWN
ncbi:putative inorganic phosphate cotransporter [Sitophilus oryzae]|uniref:Inorganic phosphate cotransporter n=1 Tax=Sitophilus oryzae TaxID=7048 RepID=A0A6J2YGU5_SITOR|nr:putative inorganic phosphate cotransporter [Sitophilus oryzae]